MAAPRKSRSAAAPAPAESTAPALALVQSPAAAAPDVKAKDLAPALAAPTLAFGAVIEQVGGLTEVIRQASASSLEQGRAAYARLKEAADEASASLEAARKVGDEGVETLRQKALETIKTSTDASFDFARALAGCKTVADAFALQSEHARKQVEAFNAQASEYSSLVQKVAKDTMSPLAATFTKGFGAAA